MENFKLIPGGICAPAGFSAAGVHCGIRHNHSKLDLALIKADVRCAGAGCYTTNKVYGAPITVDREHLKDGYEFMLPPHILTYECGLTAGQFPKFEDAVFRLTEEGFHFLLPTAETALINLYRGEILNEADLPKRLFAYTPCYRREGGRRKPLAAADLHHASQHRAHHRNHADSALRQSDERGTRKGVCHADRPEPQCFRGHLDIYVQAGHS